MKLFSHQIKVTVCALLIIFTYSTGFSQSSPCDVIENQERNEVCQSYFNEEKYPSFLDNNRVQNCEDHYSEASGVFRMCLRVSSRDERMYPEKIRACHRNFYWHYDMKNCLKFAPLITVEDINHCGKRPSDRYRPMKGMTCIGEAVYIWPLEYEERIFND